jgi:hypothetical protein
MAGEGINSVALLAEHGSVLGQCSRELNQDQNHFQAHFGLSLFGCQTLATNTACAMRKIVRGHEDEMKFDLDEIRAVFFRCNECRTAVSFPRIRWASLPERCPNCGAPWMREPTPALAFSEDTVIRAFHAANAFRDALQTLLTVARSAGFTVGMETEERSEQGKSSSDAASAGTQGALPSIKSASG